MDQNEAKAKYQQANELYRAGNYAEALALLEDLSAAFPQHKDILFAKAQCLQKTGRRDDLLVVIGQLQALGDLRADALKKSLPESPGRPRRKGIRLTRRQLAWAIAGLVCFTTICIVVGVLLPEGGTDSGARTGGNRTGAESIDTGGTLAQENALAVSLPKSTTPQPHNLSSSPLTETTASNRPAEALPNSENTPSEPLKGVSLRQGDDPHPRIIFPEPPYPGEFNLEREVARVMLDPRVPDVKNPAWEHYKRWQRASYRDIINAAREKRLSHGDPYKGERASLPDLHGTDTILVPGNITGKDTLTIRYLYGNRPEHARQIWGDDEDIVYITGNTGIGTLTIYPGTIILFSAFQNDAGRGAMTQEMIRHLAAKYQELLRIPEGFRNDSPLHRLFSEDREYGERLAGLGVRGEGSIMSAVGEESRPVVFFSDSRIPTCYDFNPINFETGILDYVITEDHTNLDAAMFTDQTNRGPIATSSSKGFTVTARCKFDNHLASGRSGSGYVVGCYFGNAGYNESLEVCYPGHEYVIRHNFFNNGWSGVIGLYFHKRVVIMHNRFEGCLALQR